MEEKMVITTIKNLFQRSKKKVRIEVMTGDDLQDWDTGRIETVYLLEGDQFKYTMSFDDPFTGDRVSSKVIVRAEFV